METVVHNIRELAGNQRSAAEQLVGHSLNEHQQIVIQIVNLDSQKNDDVPRGEEFQLPEWCNVYEGLTDEEIAEIEKAILSHRLDLTRPPT
jgi:hypothetical protein